MSSPHRESHSRGYVLHSRPYRDSSLIVSTWTEACGRVDLCARGARKPGKRPPLQPFAPLLLRWRGRSELKTLLAVESAGLPLTLRAEALYSGFYLNELLLKLLPPLDPHPGLFQRYEACLQALTGEALEPNLREFEFGLLAELGYAISWSVDAVDGAPLQPDHYYRYDPEAGFIPAAAAPQHFSGALLLALAHGQWQQPGVLSVAKQLSRQALHWRLGGRELHSRRLLQQWRQVSKAQ